MRRKKRTEELYSMKGVTFGMIKKIKRLDINGEITKQNPILLAHWGSRSSRA